MKREISGPHAAAICPEPLGPESIRAGRRTWIIAALVLLTILSVGTKILLGTAPDLRDPAALKRTLVARLITEGFSVDEIPHSAEVSLTARRGSCHLAIIEARPQGWNNALIERATGEADRLTFLFEGRTSDDLPRYRATWHYQTARILRQVGGQPRWHPVLAILSSRQCPARIGTFTVPLVI